MLRLQKPNSNNVEIMFVQHQLPLVNWTKTLWWWKRKWVESFEQVKATAHHRYRYETQQRFCAYTQYFCQQPQRKQQSKVMSVNKQKQCVLSTRLNSDHPPRRSSVPLCHLGWVVRGHGVLLILITASCISLDILLWQELPPTVFAHFYFPLAALIQSESDAQPHW